VLLRRSIPALSALFVLSLLSVLLEVNGMWKSKTNFRPSLNFLGFRVSSRRGLVSRKWGSGAKGASGKGRKRSSVTSSTALLQGFTGVPCRQECRTSLGSRKPLGWMMSNRSMTHIEWVRGPTALLRASDVKLLVVGARL